MAILIHEVWIDPDEHGQRNEGLYLAGPDGDAARAFLSANRRLLTTFLAGSHLEAMTIYHKYLGREPYVSTHEWDKEPYPEDWAERQRVAGFSNI